MDLTKNQERFIWDFALEQIVSNPEEYDGDLLEAINEAVKTHPTTDFESHFKDVSLMEEYALSDIECVWQDINTFYEYYLNTFIEFSHVKD